LILNIRISDDTYQKYSERNAAKPQEEIEKALEAFKDLNPKETRLIVAGADLKEVSKILGHPISSPKELLEHLTRSERAALPEEGTFITLSPGQRARLKAQADFFNKAGKATPAEYADFVKKQVSAGILAVVGP
jgi:hypothetical protein